MIEDLDQLHKLITKVALEPQIKIKPIRITTEEVCRILDINEYKLKKLVSEDHTFPRPIKNSAARQGRKYFDFDDVMKWKEDNLYKV